MEADVMQVKTTTPVASQHSNLGLLLYVLCYETDDLILLVLLVETILVGFGGECSFLHFVVARFGQSNVRGIPD